MRRSGRGRSQRGAALVFAVLIALGVLGLAALTVDLGLARATQASMQNAADVAALEGLRLRDDVPGDPATSDAVRRLAASNAAARVFDDDAVLATENDALFLGAGPSLELVGGFGDLNASAEIVIGEAYIPELEANTANEGFGDLVAGRHIGGAAVEAADYTRSDFTVADTDLAPAAPAFLARLRRTHDPLALDAVEGVSSSAPGLPFTFGLGTGILSDGGGYDPRRDGITVRATAIADVRRALRCGPVVDGLPGLLPVGTGVVLAVDAAAWNDASCLGPTFGLLVGSSGVVTADAPGTPCDGTTVGRAVGVVAARAVGGSVTPPAPIEPVVPDVVRGYVAVLRDVGGGAGQVIGFAAVDVVAASVSAAVGGPAVLDLRLTRAGPTVGPVNASAHSTAARAALAADPTLTGAHEALVDALLAPVLVR